MVFAQKREKLSTLLHSLETEDRKWLQQKLMRQDTASLLRDEKGLSDQELLAAESRSLVLAHLSSECNNRELVADIFRKTLANLGRTDILFRIAEQDRPLETFWLAD